MNDISSLDLLAIIELDEKPKIKKYKKIRELHREVITEMFNYLISDDFDDQKFFQQLVDKVNSEYPNFPFYLDPNDNDDLSIVNEVAFYKVHKDIESLTEYFIKNKLFDKKELNDFLESMKNSYVSLFQIIKTDINTGIVTYEDIFTKKHVRIIDVARCKQEVLRQAPPNYYFYNRIITYDGVTFGTGMHCSFEMITPELYKIISDKKFKDYSDLTHCLLLYNLYRKYSKNLILEVKDNKLIMTEID